jgi:LacI family transcriptional regulator
MPFFSASFYFSVSKALSEALQAADVDLSLHNVATRDEKNRLLDRLVADRSHDGLVLCTMGIGAERQEQLARARLPVVGVDFPIPGVPTVTVDNVAGGEMAARHVVAGGAQRVAVLSGSDSVLAFRDRERGIADVVADPPLARATAITSEAGAEACAKLLDRHPRLDALVCANDVLAAGALKVLRERGLDVPERVQVIGFDDQPLMDVLGLSTVHQPIGDFGGWAAGAVLGLIKDPTAEPPPSVVLPLTLVARGTTRARAVDRKRPQSRSTTHQEHP